ncbi:MAG: helix-turn-helix domain-containing protein, partial [Ruminiclostridium sp.]|nr:helix-turn-helix domain-containing protein [Ruminiclostridium sp.]
VRELAEQTGIPRSTAHRFLTALENYGWAAQDGDSGMYHAGLRFFLLGGRRPAFFSEVARVASGPMKRLVERTGKTAILSVLDGSGGVCIHTEEPESSTALAALKAAATCEACTPGLLSLLL